VLSRRYAVRDADEQVTTLTQRQLVSMSEKHCAVLEYSVTPQNWSGTLQIRSGIDAGVTNSLVSRYRDLRGDHLRCTLVDHPDESTVRAVVETVQSHVRVAMAARLSVLVDGRAHSPRRSRVTNDDWVGQCLSVDVEQGSTVTAEKVVMVVTSRDRAISEPGEQSTRWLARTGSVDEILSRHVQAWSHLWDRFFVDIPDKPEELRVLRLHLTHLLQTASSHTADLDVGIPARGLTGEAYRGHILWDELFVFPMLTLRLPMLTRSLLLYRYRRLPEARAAARAAGYAGAMFPWQSGSDGREESQDLHLNPASGRWIDDPTHRQRHVGLAIAYNLWQYLEATDDQEYLVDVGARTILEVARFFGSLAEHDRGLGRYVIRGVMGPDEFHSGYPDGPETGIDNNAYTNLMTVWLMVRAAEVLDRLPARARAEIRDTMALGVEEIERWDDISRRMVVPFHDGVISQFEGYERLDELDWEDYRDRYGNIQRLDRILEAENDSVNNYRASKQADVLMLFYLLSAEELRTLMERIGYALEPDAIPRTIDYYLARTSHGSTLSAVVHSWVLARAHRDRATGLFTRALRSDVTDIQGGTTPEGIHLAAMTGTVDLLQRCFAGLRLDGATVTLDPYWPVELGPLEFRIVYREHPMTIRVSGDGVSVSAEPGLDDPVDVVCRGEQVRLRSGATVSFDCSQDDS
jgi:trehalose 6-phosphate phosphatase